MEFKVLITLYFPEIEQKYELYIPINKTINQVIELIKQVVDDSAPSLNLKTKSFRIANRRNNNIYHSTDVVRNTDIRNGTELILF